MLVVSIWRISTFFPHVFKFLLVIATQQLQFMLPTVVARICVSNLIDYNGLVHTSKIETDTINDQE